MGKKPGHEYTQVFLKVSVMYSSKSCFSHMALAVLSNNITRSFLCFSEFWLKPYKLKGNTLYSEPPAAIFFWLAEVPPISICVYARQFFWWSVWENFKWDLLTPLAVNMAKPCGASPAGSGPRDAQQLYVLLWTPGTSADHLLGFQNRIRRRESWCLEIVRAVAAGARTPRES